jgi:hypothetical protein
MSEATTTTEDATGTFLGREVRTGRGGGLAGGPAVPSGSSTHFHAARLPEFGDVVLAVTRTFDPATAASRTIELRAFAASAPGRGALAQLPVAELVEAPGAVAAAVLELAGEGDAADDRRAARLVRCAVTDAAPTAAAARGVAEWLRATWEAELAFGSWPAVEGTLAAFAHDGGAVADWAEEWLLGSEHLVDGDAFLKVLSPAWIEPAGGDE